MSFLCCAEVRGFNVRSIELVVQCVDVPSSNLPVTKLNFVAFYRPFDRWHVFSHVD